jgi:LytS/YehU family sensor histidine kinase
MKKETIPPMLLQPFVENSIRHGLLLKKGKGILRISIHRLERNGLNISISDDGIGIEKAAQTIRNSPFRYVSKGSELTLKRVKLLNELGLPITIQTTSSEKGTSIEIKILSHEQ